MNTNQHNEFWRLYDERARGPIERACRSASRTLSDNGIDADELVSWVDRRVWKLLETNAWPTFHDDPSPEEAVQRLVDNAPTLARWAYLAHARKHWRRAAAKRGYEASLSRTERLAMVSAKPGAFEQSEQVKHDLAALREKLSATTRQRVAASWNETGERARVAMALGATRAEDDELIDATTHGKMKENTVQQMRSRVRRQLAETLNATRRAMSVALAAGLFAMMSLGPVEIAQAGEQTGGRGGRGGMVAPDTTVLDMSPLPAMIAFEGEQTGGRGG